MVDEGSRITQSGAAIGTPSYMSPEQWRGEAVDGRTDVYALSVMLYEILTTKLPFAGDTPHKLMYAHLEQMPPPIRGVRPDLPRAIESVIRKGMAKMPDERYGSAGDLAAAYRDAVTAYMPPTGLISDDLPGR